MVLWRSVDRTVRTLMQHVVPEVIDNHDSFVDVHCPLLEVARVSMMNRFVHYSRTTGICVTCDRHDNHCSSKSHVFPHPLKTLYKCACVNVQQLIASTRQDTNQQ